MMKKNTLINTLLVSVLLLVFSSCRKDLVPDPNNTEYKTDVEQFEAVWNGFNVSYVLWSADTTDWDAVYEQFHPIFEEMEGQPDSVWRSTWKAVFSTLIDHHMSITLHRPATEAYLSFNPGVNEVRSRDYNHAMLLPLSYRRILKMLESEGRFTNTCNLYSLYTDVDQCYSGILDGEIAYIYISSFLKELDSVSAFRHFKNLVMEEDVKAAIIDVRDNGGGVVHNLNYLFSCFTSQRIRIGYHQTKVGLGRYDLGPKVPFDADAKINNTDSQDKNIPVIVLTNINSASMSETTAIAFRYLPQGYVVGERTYGATCASPQPDDFTRFYSGSFGQSGQGHYVKTAKFLFTDADGIIYEGHGVDPDVECLFDRSAWENGVDNQLECAISFAKQTMAKDGQTLEDL